MSLWGALAAIIALAATWLLGSAPLIYLYVILAGGACFAALVALARHPGDRPARPALLLLAGSGIALALALSGNANFGNVPPG